MLLPTARRVATRYAAADATKFVTTKETELHARFDRQVAGEILGGITSFIHHHQDEQSSIILLLLVSYHWPNRRRATRQR